MNFTTFDQTFGVASLFSTIGDPESPIKFPSSGTVLACGTAALVGYALWEQVKFRLYSRAKNGNVPGPGYATPFLGGIVPMVMDPVGFWEKQANLSFPGFSWNSLVGKFTIFVTDASLVRHVFNHNGKDSLLMALHPSGVAILGDKNIAFLHGPEHKALRKSFLSLFTRRALGVYVAKQDQIIRQHIREWMEIPGPIEIRPFIRDMNAYTSQEVFVGPYLLDAAEREKFSQAYRAMTDAFLAFPLNFPGTMVWKGRQGRFYILKVLTRAAGESKQRMKAGNEPTCLLDFWSLQVLADIEEAEKEGNPPPFYASDAKMADSVMDFLFASQDASTASLCWIVTNMADYPDVLAKVREEQERVRPNLNEPITGKSLDEMPYTRQVVKETLRFRPPAPMVPQVAQVPFKLNDNYTAPKGTMIIPSVSACSMQGYKDPEKFDPDRFGPERKEDITFASNFMVFGHGPHYCVGKEYASNHLMAFLAVLSTAVNWKRIYSDKSANYQYLPTIYPGDSVVEFEWRNKC